MGRAKNVCHALVYHPERRARALGLPALEAAPRVELIENHRELSKLGLVIAVTGIHVGSDQSTELVLCKPISLSAGN